MPLRSGSGSSTFPFAVLVPLTVGVLGLAGACARQSGAVTAEPQPQGRPAVAVELAPAQPSSVVDAVDVVGSLAPKFETHIKSEYSGIVTEVYVTAWVKVRAGARLARLDGREVSTALEGVRAALLQADVAERRALREYERAGSLKEYGLVTQQQLDDARSAREAAEAATAAARAQLRAVETRLDKLLIRAPMDGVVAYRGVNVGDRVENMGSSNPMFTIVDPRVMQATVSVPSTHLAVLQVGQRLEFTIDGLPERTFAGTVKFINPSVDGVTRAATVQVDVENAGGELKGGQFLRGRIITAVRNDVLQVPRSALLDWDVEHHTAAVFVVEQDRAVRRPVRTGRAAGEQVEIAAGLEPGRQVVARGAFNLKDGDRISAAAARGL